MRRKCRLKELPAYLGWNEPGLLYLNDCPDFFRGEHQQVHATHTSVECLVLAYEERHLLVPATSRITNDLKTAIEPPLYFFSDSEMK